MPFLVELCVGDADPFVGVHGVPLIVAVRGYIAKSRVFGPWTLHCTQALDFMM